MTKKIGHRIPKKTVQTLLQDSGWTVDPELSHETEKVYQHPNGRILIYFTDGFARLFEAHERQTYLDMVETTRKEIAEYPQGRHILAGRLPQGKDFITHITDLINELPVFLNMRIEDFDYSEVSLEKISLKLKKQGRAKCTTPPLFPALVAYMGEVMCRRVNGVWRMRLSGDTKTWVPFVVAPGGRQCCDIGSNLFDYFVERKLSVSQIPPVWVRFLPCPGDIQNQTNEAPD